MVDAAVEEEIEEVETRIYNVRQQKISGDNIYQFLLYFDKLYDKFTDAEKKEFLNSFIERVDIYEQEQPDGRFLKHIKFRFPVYFNGKEIEEMSWDNETTVETVVLLSKLKSSKSIEVKIELDEMDLTQAESKATYEEIKQYVMVNAGLNVSQLYIAQVKRKHGLIERVNYNVGSGKSKVPQVSIEKEKAIEDALRHFNNDLK